MTTEHTFSVAHNPAGPATYECLNFVSSMNTETNQLSKKLLRSFLVAAFFMLALSSGFLLQQWLSNQNLVTTKATVLTPPREAGQIQLVDETGAGFGRQELEGHWSFLFFGYTNCPDVCPITLAVLKQVVDKLQDEMVRVIFVSVDPERDTPDVVQNYVRYFDPGFRGLTGAREHLEPFLKRWGVAHSSQPDKGDGNYLVDHSAAIYLTDPKGRLVAVSSTPHNVDVLVSDFRSIRGKLE